MDSQYQLVQTGQGLLPQKFNTIEGAGIYQSYLQSIGIITHIMDTSYLVEDREPVTNQNTIQSDNSQSDNPSNGYNPIKIKRGMKVEIIKGYYTDIVTVQTAQNWGTTDNPDWYIEGLSRRSGNRSVYIKQQYDHIDTIRIYEE